ncbi:MAG: rhodanese-like domain-containing protein [Gammaproteobacteria bacterium]|nr:rhodanese-like domain-containing protein [Gammaproteobacteria bacterium]
MTSGSVSPYHPRSSGVVRGSCRRTLPCLLLALALVPALAADDPPVQPRAAATAGSEAASGSVSATRLQDWLREPRPPVVLDVRSPKEFRAGHIRGAINIPHTAIGSRSGELADYAGRDIVVYCETGLRARYARWVLDRQGFTRLHSLDGHIRAWREHKLPLVP